MIPNDFNRAITLFSHAFLPPVSAPNRNPKEKMFFKGQPVIFSSEPYNPKCIFKLTSISEELKIVIHNNSCPWIIKTISTIITAFGNFSWWNSVCKLWSTWNNTPEYQTLQQNTIVGDFITRNISNNIHTYLHYVVVLYQMYVILEHTVATHINMNKKLSFFFLYKKQTRTLFIRK